GTQTVRVRTRQIDPDGGPDQFSAWTDLMFTRVAAVGDSASIDELALANDNGLSQGDRVTSDPTLRGLVSNDGGVSGLRVEFDFNQDGYADASTTTDENGAFQYPPTGLSPGLFTFRARVVEEGGDGTRLEGAWQSISFALVQNTDDEASTSASEAEQQYQAEL